MPQNNAQNFSYGHLGYGAYSAVNIPEGDAGRANASIMSIGLSGRSIIGSAIQGIMALSNFFTYGQLQAPPPTQLTINQRETIAEGVVAAILSSQARQTLEARKVLAYIAEINATLGKQSRLHQSEIVARVLQILQEMGYRNWNQEHAKPVADEEIEAEAPASLSVGFISDPAFAINGGAALSGPTITINGVTISNYSGQPAFVAENGVITMTARADGGVAGVGAEPGPGTSAPGPSEAP